jgi:HPt (histidine-containing phosphotransfer) domain-containing protein
MNVSSNLDPAAVERLQRLGGNEFVAKMIDLFAGYAGEKLTAAKAALAAGNLMAVADSVHPIKSSAGNIGAKQVQERARQIEECARKSEGDTLPQLLDDLEAAFVTSKLELDQIKQSLAGVTGEAKQPG